MTRIPLSKMIIVSDERSNRGLYVDLDKFGIYGSVEGIFWKYKLNEWHTVFIQCTRKEDNKGYVYVNDKRGEFTTTKPRAQSHSVFMGALKDGTLIPWTGGLALLEIYTYTSAAENKFPERFRDLIIDDHKRRISGTYN